jgi:hypothetical protein
MAYLNQAELLGYTVLLAAAVAAELTQITGEALLVVGLVGLRQTDRLQLPIPVAEEEEVVPTRRLPAVRAAPGLSVFGGLNKENRNELRTHQKQCG